VDAEPRCPSVKTHGYAVDLSINRPYPLGHVAPRAGMNLAAQENDLVFSVRVRR
jgi:hypothetical protein